MLQRAVFLLLTARFLCAQTSTVEGLVVNTVTHQGVPGVTVELTAADAKEPAYRAVTDSSGAFRITAVQPATYHAAYDKDRFQVPDQDPADRPFDALAGKTVELREELDPLAQLRGRVLDGEGRPAANITVDRLTASCRRVLGSSNTDADGRFTIDDLRPGAYVLRANPNRPAFPHNIVKFDDLMKPYVDAAATRRPLYAPAYYPNSTDPLLALPIVIRGGEELTGFDIHMRSEPVYRVRGVARDDRGHPAAGIAVKLRSADSWYLFNDFPPDAQMLTASDGSFDFPAVAAGEWQITAGQRRGELDLLGYAGVSVTRHDLDDVAIRMAEPFSVAGHVERIDARGAAGRIKDASVQLIPVQRPREQEAMGRSTETGAVRINHVYPGRYRIVSRTRIPGYYLDAVRLGSADVLGQEVELAPGSPSLRVEYRADGGNLRGRVEKGDAATVVLVPRDPAFHDPEFIRTASCDSEGRFELEGLRPGKYYALAFDRIDYDSLESPGFAAGLAATAGSIQVERGEVASLDLKLTPWGK